MERAEQDQRPLRVIQSSLAVGDDRQRGVVVSWTMEKGCCTCLEGVDHPVQSGEAMGWRGQWSIERWQPTPGMGDLIQTHASSVSVNRGGSEERRGQASRRCATMVAELDSRSVVVCRSTQEEDGGAPGYNLLGRSNRGRSLPRGLQMVHLFCISRPCHH